MHTATWYVCVASEPTTTKTPTMTQNRYAIAHQAKFGNVPLTAEMMEAMKVMSQASCRRYLSALFLSDAANCECEWTHTYAIDIVASANGSPTMCPRNLQWVLCFQSDASITKAESPYPSSACVCFQVAIHFV